MTLQQQIVSLFCLTFKNVEVKKVDKDNHLDIHIPALHEKRGTHIFFNTSRQKIKIGFYCRDNEYLVSLLSKYSEQIEVFSQGARPIKNPVFLTAEGAVDAAIEFVNLLLGKKQDENKKDEEVQEDNSKGYPVIMWKSDSDIPKEFLQVYAKRCQVESELYAYRMGISGYLPEWMEQLLDDNCFYPFTPPQIDEISKNITENKVIPILDFVPDQLYQHTKQVWWMVPFSIWRDSIASFLFIDKNGIYAIYEDSDGDIITNMIFPWDRIAELEFETSFDSDQNVVRMTLEIDSGGFLSYDEFVSPHRGSYLKVIASIYDVRKKTIEESKDAGTWYEGAGGEGFKRFETPLHLIDEFKWISPNRPPAAMFGYRKEPDYEAPKEWPADFLIALAMVSDKHFKYNEAKGSHEDFHQLLKNKIFEGNWENFKEEWPKGLAIFREVLWVGEGWSDVYENISKYFHEKIKLTSKESEFKIAGVIYEMWLFKASTTLKTNHEYAELKPLYKLDFDGAKSAKDPFGYLHIDAKNNFNYVKKLYELFGKNNFWKAFIANLETELQFFQIAYPLIGDFNYNSIDEGTVRYIDSFNSFSASIRDGSPETDWLRHGNHSTDDLYEYLLQEKDEFSTKLVKEQLQKAFMKTFESMANKELDDDIEEKIQQIVKENPVLNTPEIIQSLRNGNDDDAVKEEVTELFDYKRDWVLNEMKPEQVDEEVQKFLEIGYDIPFDWFGLDHPDSPQEFWDWLQAMEDNIPLDLEEEVEKTSEELGKGDDVHKESDSSSPAVILHLENCPHEHFNGEFNSSDNIDRNTLAIFESDLDGDRGISFGVDKDHEDFYAMHFRSYSNDRQKKEGVMPFGSATITSGSEAPVEFELGLTPKGLLWDKVEPDHEYLFQYHQDWVLYEMTDEELKEHIGNIGPSTGLWLDDEGMEEPTTPQEFWDTLVELNKRTGGKGED